VSEQGVCDGTSAHLAPPTPEANHNPSTHNPNPSTPTPQPAKAPTRVESKVDEAADIGHIFIECVEHHLLRCCDSFGLVWFGLVWFGLGFDVSSWGALKPVTLLPTPQAPPTKRKGSSQPHQPKAQTPNQPKARTPNRPKHKLPTPNRPMRTSRHRRYDWRPCTSSSRSRNRNWPKAKSADCTAARPSLPLMPTPM